MSKQPSIVLATTGGQWIVRDGQLCRADTSVDPLFVPPEHWEDIDRLDIDGSRLRARLCSGAWVSAELRVPAPVAVAGAGTTTR